MSDPFHPNAMLAGVTRTMLHAALAMLLALTGLVLAQVVCRDFFDLGLPWADELARFCGMALVFLAMPRLLLDNKHIAMDLVPNMLPRTGARVLAVIGRLLALAFCGIALWAIYKFLGRAWRFSTPALGIPNIVFYLPAILGFALFAVVTIYRLFVPGSAEEHALPEPDA